MTEDTLLLFTLSIGAFWVPCLYLQVIVFRVRSGYACVNDIANSSDLLVEVCFHLSFAFLELCFGCFESLLLG